MGQLLERSALPFLRKMEIPFFRSEAGDLSVPVPIESAGLKPLFITAEEETREVVLHLPVCMVPPRQRSATALLLAEYTEHYKFVQFGMDREGEASIRFRLDMAGVQAPVLRFAHGFLLLVRVLDQTYANLISTAYGGKGRQRLSLAERQVAHILSRRSQNGTPTPVSSQQPSSLEQKRAELLERLRQIKNQRES
jgi:hypothetical protein